MWYRLYTNKLYSEAPETRILWVYNIIFYLGNGAEFAVKSEFVLSAFAITVFYRSMYKRGPSQRLVESWWNGDK